MKIKLGSCKHKISSEDISCDFKVTHLSVAFSEVSTIIQLLVYKEKPFFFLY